MITITELKKFKNDVLEKIDAIIRWAEDKSYPPGGREHYRLEVFKREHYLIKGKEYLVANPPEEGGMAKRTVPQINDRDYLNAVRLFLADEENYRREVTYQEFIKNLYEQKIFGPGKKCRSS